MKKLLSYVVLALVTASVLVGCKPKEPDTMTPSSPSTNMSTNMPSNP